MKVSNLKTKIESVLVILVTIMCLYSCVDYLIKYRQNTKGQIATQKADSKKEALAKTEELKKILAKRFSVSKVTKHVFDRAQYVEQLTSGRTLQKELKLPVWVEQAFHKKKPLWWLKSEPHYSLVRYKFEKEDATKIHFIEQSFSIEDLDGIGSEDGFDLIILIEEGKMIFHTNESLRLKNVFNYAWELGEEELFEAAITALSDRNQSVREIVYKDRRHDETAQLFHSYLKDLNWHVVVKPKTKGFEIRHSQLRAYLLNSLAFFILFLGGLFFISQRIHTFRIKGLVKDSVFCSVLLLFAMLLVWSIYLYHPTSHITHNVVLNDESVEEILESYENSHKRSSHSVIKKIKTGVFVQSVEFLSGTNVKMTGVIWQKYTSAQLAGLKDDNIGVMFPESDSVDLKPLYRITDDKDYALIVGWDFQCSLRQAFDYHIYPFDSQDVWLRIKHKKFDDNIVLVPDFESYDFIAPSLNPGVEENLVMPGWITENSFYSYKNLSYNTSFGRNAFGVTKNFPELHFNVNFRRDFLGPLVTEFIPIIVAGILLFALLLIGSRKESGGLFGFSAIDVVLGCAALFFVLVFQHIALRSRFGTHSLIYMEYYYFLLYILMVVIIFNSILFASEKKIKFIHNHDNLYPKVLYWPFISASLFTVTFIYFY